MAIVHDAPEAIAGDVTPSDGISRETKKLRENLGLMFLACLAKQSGNTSFAERMEKLWKEYEERNSSISEVVHQIDKLDALQQAYRYTLQYPHLDFNDFRSHREQITDPWLALQADEVLREWDAVDSRRKSDMVIVLVVGGPGVGKGTQCALAAKEFNFQHVSVGDLLRTEQSSPGSIFRDFISESIRKSVTVPAMLTMMLLERELKSAQAQGNARILLDGFPRSTEQLKAFEEQISDRYSTIVMDCPDEILVERLSSRAKLSKREDDNPDLIRNRVETFRRGNEQVLQLLSKNWLRKIGCTGSIQEVQNSFKDSIQQIICEHQNKAS